MVPFTQIGIVGQQIFVLVDVLGKARKKFLGAIEPAQRRLQRNSADAEIRCHHALTGHRFEQAQHIFALAEAIQEHGHRADVHGVRAQPHQVRVDAGQLIQQHAQPLRARRNLQPQQLFHCQAVGEIVGHGAQIVDAVGHGHDLLVELGFAGLLDAGMQIPDVGHDAHDGLAVDLEQQPEHTMGRGMLRAHVQDHRLVLRRIQHRSGSHVSHD